MDDKSVIELWPVGTVEDRWDAARLLRILLQLVYGRTAQRRRARMFARAAELGS